MRARGRRPRSSAQSVAWMPAKPTTAFSTTSGCARSSSSVRSPPTCFSGASTSSSGDEPEAAAQSSSPGCASTISIACRPIEPVAPSRATRFTRKVYGRFWRSAVSEGKNQVKSGDARQRAGRRCGRARRRARRAAGRCPSPRMSRFSADSNRSPSAAASTTTSAEHDAPRQIVRNVSPVVVERDERDEDPGRRADDEALPRLPRRERRRELVPADQPAAEVRERVGGEDREQHREREQPRCRCSSPGAAAGGRARSRSTPSPRTDEPIATVAGGRVSRDRVEHERERRTSRGTRRASRRRPRLRAPSEREHAPT